MRFVLALSATDGHIISYHSETPWRLLVLSIRYILDECQQNRSTQGVATADFLTSGPTDWEIN